MFSNLHIDWISLTIPIDSEKSLKKLSDVQIWEDLLAVYFTCDTSKWRPTRPMFGYSEAYQSARGTIAMYGRLEMGLHIIYSGQSLYHLTVDGIDIERILKNARILRAKATRIDCALDIFNGKARVGDYEGSMRNGTCRTSSKSWRVLESGDGGHTLYIGSRSSERMVRIYDKKAERAAAFVEIGSDSWIRAEVELKALQADNFLKATGSNELEQVMSGHLRAAVDFPTIKEWGNALDGIEGAVEPTETKRKDTKTRHWLMSTVAPIIAKETASDKEFLKKLIAEIDALRDELNKKRTD